MKRRKFELLLADLWRLMRDPKRPARDYALTSATWNLADFTEALSRDAAHVRQLAVFGCALRCSDAVGRQRAEERLLGTLVDVAWQCSVSLEERELERLPGLSAIATATAEFQPTLQVLQVLHDFALGCFPFKRPRDSFGGRRRAFAFEILGHISNMVDLPDAVRLAQESSRNEESIEGRQAARFLDEYLEERDLLWGVEWTEGLPSLAEQTDSRSPSFQGPDAAGETGAMSESAPMDRMKARVRKRH